MYPPIDTLVAWLACLALLLVIFWPKDPPAPEAQLCLFDMDAIDCQGRRFHVRAWEDVA